MTADFDDVRERLNARIESRDGQIALLRSALKDCADDLEAIIEGNFDAVKRHPGLQRQYERDMVPVLNARALLI